MMKRRRAWEVIATYKETELRRRCGDPAWADDTYSTNYRLRDGQRVRLLKGTIGDAPLHSSGFGIIVPPGAEGKVKRARTPRTSRSKGSKSLYFANVGIDIPEEFGGGKTIIRVPHSALKSCK